MSDAIINEKYPDAITTDSGLKYVVTQEGTGTEKPEARQSVTAHYSCLLYTSPSPRDQRGSRMPSSA